MNHLIFTRGSQFYHNLLHSDLISNTRLNSFPAKENDEIKTFLDRAYVRLGAWFEWFNTTQLGMLDFDKVFRFYSSSN